MDELSVLVVDDEPAIRDVMADLLRTAGHRVAQAEGVHSGAQILVRGGVDIVLCDVRMRDGDGIEWLRALRRQGNETPFLMVTAFGSVETAVDALKAGAFDFVTKPIRAEELLHRLGQLAQIRGLHDENRALRRMVGEGRRVLFRFTSDAMAGVDRLVERVAPTDSTVLITGESGTGKGVFARRIHDLSKRCTGPFVSVNCSAIPETLLESEFFGHLKGAFTGADRQRKGLFQQADKGTLFLDEIGDLPLLMQTKLLHAIEEREVRPLGADRPVRVDTRIVAATNRDLQALIGQGGFREDLFFRLSMFRVQLPPLRERIDDIRGLIQFMLSGAPSGEKPRMLALDPAAEEALLAYAWPGNVRELENAINRANIMADGGRINLSDLPPEITRDGVVVAPGKAAATTQGLRERMRGFEATLIARTIEEAGGDRRVAAERLGIGLSSLYRKLDEYGLSSND